MVATLHIQVPLHCYSSASIHCTLVQKYFKHLVSDLDCCKVMDINVKKLNMAAVWKLPNAITNKEIYIHILNVCTYVQNLDLLHQKLWWVVILPKQPIKFTDQC